MGHALEISVRDGFGSILHQSREYDYDNNIRQGSELAERRRVAGHLRREASKLLDHEISRYEHARPRKEYGTNDGGKAGHDDGRADGFAPIRLESRGGIRWSRRADTGAGRRVGSYASRSKGTGAVGSSGANCGIGPGGGIDPTDGTGSPSRSVTASAEFKAWLESSKVVDEAGRP